MFEIAWLLGAWAISTICATGAMSFARDGATKKQMERARVTLFFVFSCLFIGLGVFLGVLR